MSVGESWCGWFYTPVCSYKFYDLQSTYTPYLPYTQSEAHLESSGISAMEPFYRHCQRVKAVGYFCRRAPSCIFDKMFDWILNATRPNNLLNLEEGMRRSFPPL